MPGDDRITERTRCVTRYGWDALHSASATGSNHYMAPVVHVVGAGFEKDDKA